MTQAPSIKEALQELRDANMSYSLVSDAKNARRLEQAMRDADRALATFQPDGERREAIARILHEAHKPFCDYTYPFEHDMSGRLVYERLADAILSSGLVQDEAAIRADERENCAEIADLRYEPVATEIAAAIRSARDGGAET